MGTMYKICEVDPEGDGRKAHQALISDSENGVVFDIIEARELGVVVRMVSIKYPSAFAQEGSLQSVHLQGVGRVKAKPARDLRPGDVTVWNYGYTDKVESVEPYGKHYLRVKLTSGVRQMKLSRLVAYSDKEPAGGRLAE